GGGGLTGIDVRHDADDADHIEVRAPPGAGCADSAISANDQLADTFWSSHQAMVHRDDRDRCR
ncbi:hypothetical protein, partial [Nocardioides sp. NPDC006303]|uniref:hypothetical protein n=1 Tax=Nocardioides sp. NPDC006303 TaxID=3156747 RepID=UPI00339E827B